MEDSPAPHDSRFRELRSALKNGDGPALTPDTGREDGSGEEREGPDPEGRIQAAVALVLRASEDLDVLLIRRAELDQDPWSGHMALPGGRREEPDATLLETAARETSEETGIDLFRAGTPLGRLEDVRPQSTRLPPIAISPFVFGVPASTPARVASPEVDAVLWVPLSRLQDPETLDTLTLELTEEGVKEFPGFRVEEGLVWGLTYRILTTFLDVCPFTTLPDSPPTSR